MLCYGKFIDGEFEFYEFFSTKKIRKKFVILQIIDV